MNHGKEFLDIEVDPSLKLEHPPTAESTVGRSIAFMKGVDDFQAFSSNFKDSSIHSFGNAFADSVYYAFVNHIPLELAPQHFWLLSMHALAQHISQNGEELRSKFVNFKNKKELELRRDNFAWGNPHNDWALVFEDFTKQIQQNIGEDNFKRISSNFSQTNPIEQAALNLSIMDAMKEYFTFKVSTLCGISKVRLMGTKEDWVHLADKVKGLAEYDFGWWVDIVHPILNEFVEAFSGKVNKRFWTSIYKQFSEGGSGAVTRVNGWFVNFFPYVEVDCKCQRNTYLRPLEKILENFVDNGYDHMPLNDFPRGARQVPFVWNYMGAEKKMKFVSGFSGIQINKDGFIHPVVAWAIGENKEEL